MKEIKSTVREIYANKKSLLALMGLLFVLSLGLFVYSILKINPESSIIKIGYSDVVGDYRGGYVDGEWQALLVFPLMAILFGVFHNLLAIKIYARRGGEMAKFFLLATICMIAGTFLVLIRLLGEA